MGFCPSGKHVFHWEFLQYTVYFRVKKRKIWVLEKKLKKFLKKVLTMGTGCVIIIER